MTPTTADSLRKRALALRAMAVQFRSLRVVDCFRLAGTDTWVGPSPQRCDDALRAMPITLRSQADSLGTQARRLERMADEMDAQARLSVPH